MKNFSEWLKEKLLESDMTYSKALSILGIDKDQELTTDFLEKRYRDLSLKNHPDKGGSNDSFIKIHNAFVYLKENPKRNKRSEIMKIYPTISKIFDKTWEKSTILSAIEKFFLKTQKDRLLKRGYLEEETIKHVEKYLDKVYARGTLHIEMASKTL